MSETLRKIVELVGDRQVVISNHGYDQLAADDIRVSELFSGLAKAVVIEDYPAHHKGPSVLVLQKDTQGNPIHVVWGIPRGRSSPAVLVTAYKPDPLRWSSDFLRRV